MTKEEVKDKLLNLGFTYERNEEYHRDEYTSMYKNTKVEIFVDYYSLKLVWWYEPNKKAAKCFYLRYITESLDEKFIEGVIMDLAKIIRIKGYDYMESYN